MTLLNTFKSGLRTLPPSAFSVVMATGIVSIGAQLLHYEVISQLLFFINKIQFAVLFVLLILRAIMFRAEVVANFSSHAEGAGFLTVVAASSVLGMQFVVLEQNFTIAVLLWLFGLVIWLIMMYSFFISVITKEEKPSLEKGLNGSWLLIVVSTQSLSVLASTIQNHLPIAPEVTAFFSFSAFLLGLVFYIVIITLVLYRLLFIKLSAEEFTPPYWIDMGACGITALAAATLTATSKYNPFLSDVNAAVKTLAVLSWAVGTWWIPIIIILEIWRHVVKKFPLRYDTGYWSMVFPLGMYTVCTSKMASGYDFHFLQPIAQVFMVIAVIAWTITFLAMCGNIIKQYVSGSKPEEAG